MGYVFTLYRCNITDNLYNKNSTTNLASSISAHPMTK